MYALVTSKRFKKNLKTFIKKHPDLINTITERTLLLQQNPRHKSLKMLDLTGKLKGTYAVSITFEYRLVLTIHENEILLLAIGTHDEVY